MTFIFFRSKQVKLLYVQTCIYYIYIIILHIGTVSYKQPVNLLVWSHCYLEYAHKAPPFYSREFERAANAILAGMNMTRQDISINDAKRIYLHLCHMMLWSHYIYIYWGSKIIGFIRAADTVQYVVTYQWLKFWNISITVSIFGLFNASSWQQASQMLQYTCGKCDVWGIIGGLL